ncbi:pollen-specific leucine-rich repeat extensin-like protein 3 [Iris pallida]|uniref:Pollen-specific leucine-rich repeat extensin-like protein 3 n=1 Tax=Iris pallida TaxID=29817 RepID=A0AAX6FCH7_IRIPA|nr:pollen-specific leucine-rich repeat extensin-like protein 3 [Iris pallida]
MGRAHRERWSSGTRRSAASGRRRWKGQGKVAGGAKIDAWGWSGRARTGFRTYVDSRSRAAAPVPRGGDHCPSGEGGAVPDLTGGTDLLRPLDQQVCRAQTALDVGLGWGRGLGSLTTFPRR